mmetsp:Transcript_25280/g.63646  ORF Transcript_25280/g.63646 Transcript_25280/m.63646 type:complete len:570 (+) Transcript_25280:122-1831(+)
MGDSDELGGDSAAPEAGMPPPAEADDAEIDVVQPTGEDSGTPPGAAGDEEAAGTTTGGGPAGADDEDAGAASGSASGASPRAAGDGAQGDEMSSSAAGGAAADGGAEAGLESTAQHDPSRASTVGAEGGEDSSGTAGVEGAELSGGAAVSKRRTTVEEVDPDAAEDELPPSGDEAQIIRRDSSSSASDGENGDGHFLRNFIRSVVNDEIAALKRPGSSGSGSAEEVQVDPNSMDEIYLEEEDEEEPTADGKKGPPAKRASAKGKKKAKSKAKAKPDAKSKAKVSPTAKAEAKPTGEGDGSDEKGGAGGDMEGAPAGPVAPTLDFDKLRDEIKDMVREVWKDEVTVESKNEKQLLDILRLRDNEVIKAHEKVAELTGLLLAADKTLEAMKEQVKEAEREKDELHDRMVAARVTEQKANTIVDANTKRSNDLARDLETEKKRRQDERVKLEQMVEQAKEDHRVEVMAYRRALSTEEAKVVTQQRETKELRERIAELQASKPGMAGGAGVLGMTASSKFFSSSSAASTARDRKGSTRKKKGGMIKSVESIYTPLSTGSLPKISANNTGYGRF